MNLRTLKKLSKRAAPLLPLMGDRREQFAADGEECSVGVLVGDRKHWERAHCHPAYQGHNWFTSARGAEIVFTSRAGRRIAMRPPSSPRKGTIMVGGMSGGEEPEWSDQPAWEALVELVGWHFTAWDGEDLVPTRRFRTPADWLRGGEDMVRDLAEARSHG